MALVIFMTEVSTVATSFLRQKATLFYFLFQPYQTYIEDSC